MKPSINITRLSQELESLASISDASSPEVTRVVFSPADLRAREWFKGLCNSAGLTVREDAVGNTFARWAGRDSSLAFVGTGSHIDAIPHSGMYDGTVGVLGGLEAIRSLKEAGFHPERSIELLLFTSEEPTRFGIGCLGSRLLSGVLDASADEDLRDSSGDTLREVRRHAGFQGSLESCLLPAGYYSAFVELHIEQGPLLERRNLPIGIVRAIAAPASLEVTVQGEGGHAGAVLMSQRHDAFLAAAEIALALERSARSTGSVDSVATTGVCNIFPGAVNSVPSRVTFSADIRDTDGARRDSMILDLETACAQIAASRGVSVHIATTNRDQPCTCDPRLVETVAAACEELGMGYDGFVSRAYHDTLFLSKIAPATMIFIPCHKGISHTPDEFATPEAIASGVEVLALTLAKLSSG